MAQWSEGYCQANGIEIHYLRTSGAKPSVVCLHGFTDDGGGWIAAGPGTGGRVGRRHARCPGPWALQRP